MTDDRKYSIKRCNNAIQAADTLMETSDTPEGRAYWAGHKAKWMGRLASALKESK